MLTAGALNQVYTGTAVTPVLPSHTTGDILIAVGMHNGAGTLAVSGWTQIAAENNANLSSGAWYKVAASGAESNPVITSSGSATSALGLFAQTFKAPGTSYASIGTAIWSGPTSSTTPTGSTVVTVGASADAVTFGLVDTATSYSSGLPPAGWTTVDNSSAHNYQVPTIVVGTLAASADTSAPFTVTCTLPTHQTDDILVVVAGKNNAADLTIDAGWNTIVTSQNSANYSNAWWWKRATSGAETNPTVTSSTTGNATTAGIFATAFRIRGCITTGTPFEGGTVTGAPTTSTTPTTGAVTTQGFQRLVVSFVSADDNPTLTGFPLSGWGSVTAQTTTVGGDHSIIAMSQTQASPTTTSVGTVTTFGAAAYWRQLTLAFIPAVAGEGRITTIEQIKATPGTVSGATIATLPSAAYWKTLSVVLEPSLTQTITTPTSIASSEAFGSPTVTPGAVTITTPTSIASSEAFGSPAITTLATINTPTSIVSGEAFGSPTVTPGAVTISMNSINSAEAFDNPTVTGGGVQFASTLLLMGCG